MESGNTESSILQIALWRTKYANDADNVNSLMLIDTCKLTAFLYKSKMTFSNKEKYNLFDTTL